MNGDGAKRYRLLVVDDEEYAVEGVMRAINWEAVGIDDVRGAGSVREAQQAMRDRPADVVICDIEMAQENGLDFLRWLRENQYSARLIFLTAYARFEYAQEAIGLGAAEFLVKPIDHALLRETVGKVLEQYETERMIVRNAREYEKIQEENLLQEGTEESDLGMVDKIRRYIAANLMQELSRETIAQAVFLNPSYLSRMFHKETGEKLSDYITRMRIEEAKRMLETSDKKITAIAHALGYSNDSYFIRAFRNLVQMTPYEYRKAYREGRL